MAFLLNRLFPNITRSTKGSAARAAAELANALAAFDLSSALTAAGCALATTTTQAKTTATLAYTVGGKFFSKAATDNFWTLSGKVVPAGSFQKYLLLIDTAGAATVQEATPSVVNAASVTWANVSNASPYAALLTVLGSTKCIVGTLTITTDATHPFTPGTTALNATGITATFQDGPDQALFPILAGPSGALIGAGA